MLEDGLTVVNGSVVGEHVFEKTVQERVFSHHLGQHRQEDFYGNGIEIVVDVELVRPHFAPSDSSVDVKDGIARFLAATERITVGREALIIVIELEGDEFEQQHFVGRIAIYHPFLSRAHLVDNLLARNAQASTLHYLLRQRKVLFAFHITVGFVKLMPSVTTLQQAIGKKLFPSLLPTDLR